MPVLDKLMPPIVDRILRDYGVGGKLEDLQVTDSPATLGTTWVPRAQNVRCSPPAPLREFVGSGQVGIAGETERAQWTAMISARGLTWEPTGGQLLVVGGRRYRIIRATPHYSGEKIAAWELELVV